MAASIWPNPYSTVQAVIAGGAPVTGGQYVTAGQTVALSGVSTIGWVTSLWEIFDYPPGWPTPAGWTMMSSGIMQFTGSAANANPPQFTLPAVAPYWGKWAIRNTVNGGIDPQGLGNNPMTGAPNPRMVDTSFSMSMVSPHLLRDMFVGEDSQFGGIPNEKWVRDYKWNLRILEAFLASGGGGGGSGSTLNFVPVVGPATFAAQPGYYYGLDTTGGAITVTVASIVAGPAYSKFGVISWCDVAAGNTVIQDPSVAGHTITINNPAGGNIQDPENIASLSSTPIKLTIKGEGATFFFDGANLVLTP